MEHDGDSILRDVRQPRLLGDLMKLDEQRIRGLLAQERGEFLVDDGKRS